MDLKLTLDIAICTYGPEGISRVARMDLPVIEDVRYVISWQKDESRPIPQSLLDREDVTVGRTDSVGLSNNRNNSLALCTGDIVLIADDDLTFYPDGIRQILDIYRSNPGLEFATFVCEHESPRRLPQEPVRLSLPLPKGYSVGSWEISFRREAILRKGIKFHPELGLNAPSLQSGEDEFFLLCAIKNGLDCRFFPIRICAHPHESTGTKSRMTAGNLRGSGCIIRLYYPWSWPLRVLLKAWRLSRRGQASLFPAILHLLQGAAKAPQIRRGCW